MRNLYKLFSERIKNKNGEPEVYSYDVSSKAFRNQVFYIMADVLDIYEEHGDSLWDYMHDSFAREMGLKKLGRYGEGYKKNNIEEFVDESFNDAFLDLVDYIFHLFYMLYLLHRAKFFQTLFYPFLVQKALLSLSFVIVNHMIKYL